jgi:hypothetical protein
MRKALTTAEVVRRLLAVRRADTEETETMAKGRRMGVFKKVPPKPLGWGAKRANRGQAMRERAGLAPIPKANYQGMGVVKGK